MTIPNFSLGGTIMWLRFVKHEEAVRIYLTWET
jgi:hypothetical protein